MQSLLSRMVINSVRPTLLKNCLHTTSAHCDAQTTEKTINQVTLLGRVGADPQKRGSEEHPVINFPLATHFSYKYESGDILQRTDWHRISVFRPGLRDTVYKYLKKGQRVYVTGKLSYGEVKLDDGQVRTASTVIADDIIFFQSQQEK
ncbi:single-stranded DNA-binding protein, mitochondrial [Colias croceus]|uniref:single-stranded DNA-binding protein, mitochondrial n=1 Tax=Colias crocea TaxID=72248 RepID=UPI001E27BB95|nr:single-stranded DNA-binding protein, mitochondrial [Colias croceus]